MENYKQFEQELASLDTDPQSPLAPLCRSLRHHSPTRSDFHQRTAWTRLSARFSATPESSPVHSFWLRFAAPCALGVIIAAFYFQPRGSSSPDSYAFNDAPAMPVVHTMNPKIYVKPFHSKEAKADVIWAVGYDYIPASAPAR